MATKYPYTEPVKQLLTLGDAWSTRVDWPDYRDMGLTKAHIPELIHMATDPELNWADTDDPAVYAPVHAWRALGELHAKEAIAPLITLAEELEDDDLAGNDLPPALALIGSAAIHALRDYLADPAKSDSIRMMFSESLVEIAILYPRTKDRIIDILTLQLGHFRDQETDLNAFLVSMLIDLQATRASSVIKLAFEEDAIDISMCGNWKIVQKDMGLLGNEPADYGYNLEDLRFAHLVRYLEAS